MPNNCKKIEKIKSTIRVVLSFVLTFVTVSSVSKNEKIVNEYLSKRYSIKRSILGEEYVEDLKSLYFEAITYVSGLYETLDLSDSIECYYVYNYLDDHGFLSLDNSTKSLKNIPGHYLDLYLDNIEGADILYKKGLCRHEADFYYQTLVKYNIDAITCTCYIGECNKEYRIKRPNHVIVVAKDNGITYQDTLNNVIFDKMDSCQEDVVFGLNSDNFIYMMPDESSSIRFITTQNTQSDVDKLNSWIKSDTYSVDVNYINKRFSDAQKKIDDHQEDIESFNKKYSLNIKNKLPDK